MKPTALYQFYHQGEVIFRESEPGECAYIVEEGEVDLLMLFSGKLKLIDKLIKGDILGEMSPIDNALRTATAIAAKDTKLIKIPNRHFNEKIEHADPFISMLLKILLERYRSMRLLLDNLTNNIEFTDKYSLYTPKNRDNDHVEENEFTIRQLVAENNLQDALINNQLELFYQPIISLTENKIAGCEALIRWRHPERGLIPPADFIGLAEESGLIVPIGLWIIECACETYAKLTQTLNHDLAFISINLSGKQFIPPDLIENIQRIFETHHINPKTIKFEITETILMANPLHTANILNKLKKLGSYIAIDDFGTGYSSFSYLHRFPIDTLKIDKSFVSTMLINAKSFQIVKTLCLLAKSIGMTIVAEGIESENENLCLKEMGVDYGQGYFYAKPLPIDEFQKFLVEFKP